MEILVVVTQCLLLPAGTHYGCTTHTVSLRGGGGGGGDPSRSYAVSAPADRDASQLYYSYRIIKGGGGAGGGGGDPSRSYAVSAPADRDASQIYYSCRIIKGGGGGILVVVTQCLLLPTGTHHSYTTHTVSLRGGGGGERARGYSE